ncbi:MAG: glycoside hydrolase family 2 TIM barrel-domain containing protein, partial [Chloroflexota bacterium]
SLGLRILDELYRNNIMVIMTVDNAVNDTGRISWVVSSYQNHPAILMWSLGNEWNINRYYGVASSVLDAAQRTQNAAALIKSLDTVHPVVSSYGEINFGGPETQLAATQNYVNNVCPSVDVWGLNLYRGQTFTTLWSQWASIATKPMFIGEFGVDAYETTSGTVNEAAQAQWDVSLWDDIARNLSANDPAKVALAFQAIQDRLAWAALRQPGERIDQEWVDQRHVQFEQARKEIEAQLDGKVFLELHVKVREGWRQDEQEVRRLGYDVRGEE